MSQAMGSSSHADPEIYLTCLVTGFEPFGGETLNPSKEVLQHLPDHIGPAQIITAVLPVEFARSQIVLFGLLEEYQPEVLIMLGEAGGRGKISLERVALNWMEARIPDHAGFRPTGEHIFPDAENALFSTLPLEQMYTHLERAQIPVEYSLSAGSYVCNSTFFAALDYLQDLEHDLAQDPDRDFKALTDFPPRAGFIHLPYLPQQTHNKTQSPIPCPSLELDVLVAAVQKCLEVCVQDV
jgi:pyroglutamyl-peptidase